MTAQNGSRMVDTPLGRFRVCAQCDADTDVYGRCLMDERTHTYEAGRRAQKIAELLSRVHLHPRGMGWSVGADGERYAREDAPANTDTDDNACRWCGSDDDTRYHGPGECVGNGARYGNGSATETVAEMRDRMLDEILDAPTIAAANDAADRFATVFPDLMDKLRRRMDAGEL